MAMASSSAWGQGSTQRSCDTLLSRVERNDATLKTLVILPIKTFSSDDVERLARALQTHGTEGHVRSIAASGHAVSPALLVVLGRAVARSRVSSLAVGDKTSGDTGIVALLKGLADTKTKAIETLDLSYKDAADGAMKAIGEFFAASGTCSSLKRLDLSRNERIGDSGIAALASSSTDSIHMAFHRLCHLNLSQCNIGPSGTHTLTSLLLHNRRRSATGTATMELIMNSNPLGQRGCAAIGSLLNCCSSIDGVADCDDKVSILSSLSLRDCGIDDDGLQAMVQAAQGGNCDGLTHLDMSQNQISSKGTRVLSRALHVPESRGGGSRCTGREHATSFSTLKELLLAENDIGAEGVLTLTSSLVQRESLESHATRNDTLTSLDLSKTNCGSDGAIAALKCGATSSIRLFGNRIGSDGINAASESLRGGHPSLVELDLGGNDANEKSVAKLIQELCVLDEGFDSALRTLEIGGNEVTEGVEEEIKKLGKIRPELDVARDKPKTANVPNSIKDDMV